MGARAFIVAVAVLLAVALPATAGMFVTVTATATGGASVTQEFVIPCVGGISNWALAEPVAMMAGNTQLGTIKAMTLESDSEPYVNLFWSVQAGAADTTFDFSTAVVSFSPLVNPLAYASAGVTLTGDANGATITGGFDDGRIYQARYNGSTVYSNLVGGFSAAANTTATPNDRLPASGYATISGSVSSIEAQMKFTLSAGDQASATSRFEVVPEPATMSLLALGGMAALIRRRRRAQA